MSKPTVNPEILAALDEERGAMASSGRNFRQLTLKAGESALARFLPVEMGPKKTWFARIARHWGSVLKRPVLCVRQTSPNFGGNPEAPCLLCDLEAEFSQSRNKETQEDARRLGAYPRILTYLFVFETTDDRGHRLPTAQSELYVPNDYWVSKEGWKEIDHLWRRSLEKNPPFGFLDPVTGYDFTISRDRRNGYRHSREDPAPIEKNRSVDEMLSIIDKAFAKIKKVDTTPPTEEELEAMAAKVREKFESSERRPTGRGRGDSSVDRDEDDHRSSRRGDDADAGVRRGDETTPSRRDPDPEPPSRSRRATSATPRPSGARGRPRRRRGRSRPCAGARRSGPGRWWPR